MIADTAMALFELAPAEMTWYKDRAAVRRALDAILDTSLGELVQYAGLLSETKKAPDRAAVHALVATGKDDIFALQDAKKRKHIVMVLSIVDGALKVDVRYHAPEPTTIDDLAAVAVALRDCGVFLGMRYGYVRPLTQSQAMYAFERKKPRTKPDDDDLRSGAILDLIDTRFNASDGPGADANEVKLAKSKVPSWVERTEADGLVTLKWAKTFEDKQKLDHACEAHEDWFDHIFR